MFDHTGVPNMGKAHFFDLLQGLVRNIIEFAGAVLFNRTVVFITWI